MLQGHSSLWLLEVGSSEALACSKGNHTGPQVAIGNCARAKSKRRAGVLGPPRRSVASDEPYSIPSATAFSFNAAQANQLCSCQWGCLLTLWWRDDWSIAAVGGLVNGNGVFEPKLVDLGFDGFLVVIAIIPNEDDKGVHAVRRDRVRVEAIGVQRTKGDDNVVRPTCWRENRLVVPAKTGRVDLMLSRRL